MVFGHVPNVVDERQVQFAQVRGFSGPVVHLHIDVRMDVRVPSHLVNVVPDTLQVSGKIDTA